MLVDQGVNLWLERTPFLDFEGFSFWEKYKSALEESLSKQEQSLDSGHLSVEEKERMEKNYENTRKNFEAIMDEEKHNEMVESGQRELSYRALQAALLIFLYRDQPVLYLPYRLHYDDDKSIEIK